MTKRCRFCGVKMADAVISGKDVWQCPVCGYVVEKPISEEKTESSPEIQAE